MQLSIQEMKQELACRIVWDSIKSLELLYKEKFIDDDQAKIVWRNLALYSEENKLLLQSRWFKASITGIIKTPEEEFNESLEELKKLGFKCPYQPQILPKCEKT